MESYRSGDIVLLEFPFTDAAGTKRRPALVLLDLGDADIVVARVTSQIAQTAFDVELVGWQQAGLRLPSVVRVHKLATLEKNLVEHRLGTLATADWVQVQVKVQQLWASIRTL